MIIKLCSRPALALAVLLTVTGCQDNKKLIIRRNRDGQELTSYRLRSLTGTRDGDKLTSELVVADNAETLTMMMKFQIAVPPRLEAGTYLWQHKNAPAIQGTIKADNVIFQGNQNSPPSLGGTFQLMSEDVSLYQVKVPATLMDAPPRSPSAK